MTTILGVRVDALTAAEAVDWSARRAADRASRPVVVVNVYVEVLDRALGDRDVSALLDGCDLLLCNGIAVQWAATWVHRPGGPVALLRSLISIVIAPRTLERVIPTRLHSLNYTWPLLERGAAEGLRVFLVGSPRHQTIDGAADHLRAHIPGIDVVGTFTGQLDAALEAELGDRLRQAQPDLILVAMGFPRQERLMARLTSQLEHGVMVGEGGTFDYREYGGAASRAPVAVQRLGLEWLWRLVHEPWRARRQLAIPRLVWRVYRSTRRNESRSATAR